MNGVENMLKEKIEWDNGLKKYSLFLSLITFILLIICFATKQSQGALICITIMLLIIIFLTLYLYIFSIFVFEDKIEIKSIFGSKKYEFSDVIIKEEKCVRIFNKDYKELIRIANFMDPNSLIYKTYKKYINDKKIKHIFTNNKIKYNYYIRNISLFGVFFSLAFFIFSIILFIQKKYGIYDDINNIEIVVILLLGIIFLILSIYGLLSYKNFEICILNDEIILRNAFGISKTYRLCLLSCTFSNYTIKILLSNKKITLLYYFMDNTGILSIYNIKN